MKNHRLAAGIFMMTLFTITSCSKDDDNAASVESESYNTTFKMTDAPIDNANVEAVFVTIADVKVDGNSLEGFSKTTIELSALVDGKTETLGNLGLAAGSYSSIELQLDYVTDDDGNTPGCWIETVDGEKDAIEASASKISVNDAFEVFASASNEVVIDFDLRKTIKDEQATATTSDFEFVSVAELATGIRVLNIESTGKISGRASESQETSDKIVAYAYEKGTFDAETETTGKGDSNITFANAVTSSTVASADGSYSLDFLSEGDYELVFVSYNKDGDQFFFNSLLEAESNTGLDLGAISVSSTLQLSTNVTITGSK